ncbi:MAG: LPS export ABC transporter periplasmic protein LptC [Maricaulaceae bacterium]
MGFTQNISNHGDHAASEALGLWEPKRTLTLEAAQKHSVHIRLFRHTLLCLTVGLIGLLMWQFLSQPKGFDLDDNPAESVRMTNPRYSGRTNDGLPYYLTSAEAVRERTRSAEVMLTDPVLEFYRSNSANVSKVAAQHGVYDDVQSILELTKAVDLQTDDGYKCQTAQARIFTKDKEISGAHPMACQGNFGIVNGNSFEITNAYNVFTFKDGMSAQIQRSPSTSNDETTIQADNETSFGFAGNSPVDIAAQQASYDKALTTLTGNVVVIQDDATLKSDDMIIYRAASTEAETGSVKLGEITKIDAQGNFYYETPVRTVTGDRGIYDRSNNTITVTGNVLLLEKSGNKIRGNKLVYNTLLKSVEFGDKTRNPNNGQGRVNVNLSGG